MAFDKKAYQRQLMRDRRAAKKNLRRDAESTVCTGPPERENDRSTVPDVVGEIPTPATNLPVPVLAEPTAEKDRTAPSLVVGEVRESTTLTDRKSVKAETDSRGGQTLSKSDQLKDQDRPGWYIFGDVEREKNCWKCGKKFTTRLEMGRFCSPKCRNEFLDSTFSKKQNEKHG